MAMRSRTPWKPKLHPEQVPHIVPDRRGRMLIPTPLLLNIIAGATEEALAEDRAPIAPYWRVVDEQGRLPAKSLPGRAGKRPTCVPRVIG